jgi:hypothetical protein
MQHPAKKQTFQNGNASVNQLKTNEEIAGTSKDKLVRNKGPTDSKRKKKNMPWSCTMLYNWLIANSLYRTILSGLLKANVEDAQNYSNSNNSQSKCR